MQEAMQLHKSPICFFLSNQSYFKLNVYKIARVVYRFLCSVHPCY